MNDLKSLLSDALGLLGCDASKYEFDAHSPISINFTDIGDLVLVPDGEYTWFWNQLAQGEVESLAHRADALLVRLSEAAPFMLCGALSIRSENNDIWIGGPLVPEQAGNAEALAAAIEAFHGRMVGFKDVLA